MYNRREVIRIEKKQPQWPHTEHTHTDTHKENGTQQSYRCVNDL